MLRQGLSLDKVFIMQRTQDKEIRERFIVINGEQPYLMLADNHTGKLWYVAYQWVSIYAPSDIQNKYVLMDQRGETAICSEVFYLLYKYKYTVRVTSPEYSHHNYPAER